MILLLPSKTPKEVMEFITDCLPVPGHLLSDVAFNLICEIFQLLWEAHQCENVGLGS